MTKDTNIDINNEKFFNIRTNGSGVSKYKYTNNNNPNKLGRTFLFEK